MISTNRSIQTAVIVGSLRKESFSRMVAKALMAVVPKSMVLEILEIGQLPMYNQDLDVAPPKEWVVFRNRLKNFDAVIFVTPEYNRSIPGVLKNAIDVASRPYGKNVLNGKAGAIISVTVGALGGFGANHHLRQSLVFLNMPTMQQPEAYISNAAKLFEANGDLNNDESRTFLTQFMAAFVVWVTRQQMSHVTIARPIELTKTDAPKLTSDKDGHYDIDGVSLAEHKEFDVIVASDARH